MATVQRVIVDQIEINRRGPVQVRLLKLVEVDGQEVFHEPHRTAINPGGDTDEQINEVNAHLASMSPAWPAISDDYLTVQDIRDAVAVAHTEAKITDFRRKRDEELKKLQPEPEPKPVKR